MSNTSCSDDIFIGQYVLSYSSFSSFISNSGVASAEPLTPEACIFNLLAGSAAFVD